jgi:hypothetical protein
MNDGLMQNQGAFFAVSRGETAKNRAIRYY